VSEALLLGYQMRCWAKYIPFYWNCSMFHNMYFYCILLSSLDVHSQQQWKQNMKQFQ